MQEFMSLATQIGIYAKFTPKQKATTLFILHAPSAILWLTGLVVSSYNYRLWGNVPMQNLLAVESVFG